ncbi:FecR family protein [Maribacter sedimenticola]|uniref:FecR family protein n=1 Tax=Maribacter sedimenticola TaxID=228956 RepID=A0ABY1SDY0_9FLAO|nr:FecR family protein [Maribacter sedimenticola]SNR29855.1 FecR family protein [Maribacter sedimenticola]
MQENYLAKWLNNELTEAEMAEFKKSEAYATYKKIKDVASNLEAPAFDMDTAYNSLEQNKVKESPKVFTLAPYKPFLRIAAAITVLLVASFFYLNTLNKTITTSYAENKTITLPDTSEVILNADSELAYNEKKWDDKRNIELEGEAYFKVAKGKKFTVATTHGTVSVLGTQFNVENRKDYFEVACYEGMVSVTINGKETKLPAGNSLLAINGKSSTYKVAVNGKPSWLSNESSFRSIPLHYVMDELQRQYNIKVTYSGIDKEQLFTGSFNNDDLELALKSISVPLQIKFKLDGNQVLFYEEKAP